MTTEKRTVSIGEQSAGTSDTAVILRSPRLPQASEDSLGQLSQRLARGGMSRREFLKRADGARTQRPRRRDDPGRLRLHGGRADVELAEAARHHPAASSRSSTGASTSRPTVKKSFEKKYGIKVVESYYDSNEALLAKLQAGATGYDVIVPDGMTVHIMLEDGAHPAARTWTTSPTSRT